MKKIIFVLIIFLSAYSNSFSQTNPGDLYQADRFSINPAIAGSTPYTVFSSYYTQYRSGMGDPKDVNLMGHTSVFRRVGLGFKLYSLSQGSYVNNSGFELVYSYQLPISTKGDKVGFGLGATLFQQKYKRTFNPADVGDPVLEALNDGVVYADAVAGITFYRQNKYFVDLSSYYLIENEASTSTMYTGNKLARHYFVSAGYSFGIGEKKQKSMLRIEPNILFKAVGLIDMYQIEGGLNFYLKDYIQLGARYRGNGDIIIMGGFGNKNFTINYAYGLSGSGLADYNNGRHSIGVVYRIYSKKTSKL